MRPRPTPPTPQPRSHLSGAHPGLIALTLALGAVILLWNLQVLYFPDLITGVKASAAAPQLNHWIGVGAGALLWCSGCAMYSYTLWLHPVIGFLLGLLFVPGLILVRIFGHKLTPHEAWKRENSELQTEQGRRLYRPVKALY
jgi:hypothetical protein